MAQVKPRERDAYHSVRCEVSSGCCNLSRHGYSLRKKVSITECDLKSFIRLIQSAMALIQLKGRDVSLLVRYEDIHQVDSIFYGTHTAYRRRCQSFCVTLRDSSS
jgi:hypothetical protein